MKKALFLSSVLAITAVIGNAHATDITTTGGKDSTSAGFTEQPVASVTGLAIADTT